MEVTTDWHTARNWLLSMPESLN